MDRLKLYPDGSVTLASAYCGSKRKSSDGWIQPDDFIGVRSQQLGLSSPTISHTVSSDTKRQGSSGMTARQRREVRCNSVVLTSKLGRKRCAFVTLTFPFHGELLEQANRQFNEIMRLFNQRVRRCWERLGLPESENQLLFVAEPQTKRWRKHGEFALHAHLVVPARLPGTAAYLLKPDDVQRYWRDACVSVLGQAASNCRWDAATQIDRVKRDPAAYLSKYMGKGCGELDEFLNAGVSVDQLPKRWWGATDSLKRETHQAIQAFDIPCGVSYEDVAALLNATGMFLWCRCISIERGDETRTIGVCGRLRREVRVDQFLPVAVAILRGQYVPSTPQNLPLAG